MELWSVQGKGKYGKPNECGFAIHVNEDGTAGYIHFWTEENKIGWRLFLNREKMQNLRKVGAKMRSK